MLVATGKSTHSLALWGEPPGRMPMVVPFSDLAPLHTASITPVSPPQTSVMPRRASSLPTPSARAYTWGGGS